MSMQIHTPAEEATLVMSRVFDAPRDLVWTALTEPKHVVRWYGGHGFENPVCEMDVRPGGRWRHVMRTPDGAEHAMEFVFVEVVKPEKLVWQHADHGKGSTGGHPTSVMTVTLEEAGRQTKWTLVARFSSTAERELALRMGFTTVLSQGCDRFDEVARSLGS